LKARLVERAEEYRYSSASERFELAALPPGLKTREMGLGGGAAKAAPFQSEFAAQGECEVQGRFAVQHGFAAGELSAAGRCEWEDGHNELEASQELRESKS
jgi:hypothetical protein